MAEYRRSEIISGLFIVLSVIVFALFAFKVKGLPIWFFEDEGVECEAWFDDVKGLDQAAKVTAGGHRIGTVTSIARQDQPFTQKDLDDVKARSETLPAGWSPGRERQLVRVRFKITDKDVRRGDDATIAVVQEGFIGPYYLSFDPGTWDVDRKAPLVRDLTERPLKIPSRRTESLQDFIPALRPIIQQVDAILNRIQTDLLTPLLEGRSGDLSSMIPALQGALSDARAGINEMRQVVDPKNADSPIKHFNTLMDDTNKSIAELKQQLLTDVVPPLKEALGEGTAAIKAAKTAIDGATAMLDESKPHVKELLDNLRAESGRLQSRIDDVQKNLTRLLQDADHVISLRQADLALMMESLRNTAWEIELAARKVRSNPAVLIFGDEEDKRLEAAPRDDTGLRKSGRVKPYDQRDESPIKK
jgi:ABC-type transporter Mla subunit MlaD